MNWTLYSYRLGLITKGHREGLILRCGENWGEIAPLPGRSTESLLQAQAQLLTLLKGGKLCEDLFPSVRFGLEASFTPHVAVSVPLYALLTGDANAILHQAKIAENKGYTIAKLKVSSLPLETIHSLIENLRQRFQLRIDCNSAFSFEQALAVFSPFDTDTFEYIEDPTYELTRLAEFPFPIALDETVLQYQSLHVPNLYGFVLKPTVLGGKIGCAPLIDYARKNNLKIIFSSAFESGLGLLQIISLAKQFNLVHEPLGLDTYRFLMQDLLKSAVDFNAPQLTVKTAPQINRDILTEIAHGTCELPPL